jgi:oligogalacturonide lyase
MKVKLRSESSMPKGTIIRSVMTREKDKITGIEVTRLTDNQGNTIHPYFTQPLFSDDGRFLLVTSDRTGSWQLYSLELSTGVMIQLTDEPGINPHSPCLDGKRMIAYYWSGTTLKSVNLADFHENELYRTPKGFHPGALCITADGLALDFCYSETLKLSTVTGKLYSEMSETLFRRPTSVVMRVNTQDGTGKALWGEREWISHVITSPVDREIVVFCHEGHWHLVQRTWVVRADTSEVWPLVVQKPYLERAGHEFFTRQGHLVTQYGIRATSTAEWQCSDVFVNPDGSGMRKFDYLPGPKPMHVQVNSTETFGVADSAYMVAGPPDGKRYMALVKYESASDFYSG